MKLIKGGKTDERTRKDYVTRIEDKLLVAAMVLCISLAVVGYALLSI